MEKQLGWGLSWCCWAEEQSCLGTASYTGLCPCSQAHTFPSPSSPLLHPHSPHPAPLTALKQVSGSLQHEAGSPGCPSSCLRAFLIILVLKICFKM